MTMTLAFGLDIDGVVADGRHRAHLVHQDPPDWEGFFALMDQDAPYAHGVVVAKTIAERFPVVWMTGRPERYRQVTRDWLALHDLPPGRLIMRPDGARPGAGRLKVAQAAHLRAKEDTLLALVLDDDPLVVEALVEHRVPASLVTWHGESTIRRRS